MKVSVIIPVYNSTEYLSDAIESILHQSYKDFELILINDNSLDESGVICEKYKNIDDRIRVFHNIENKGISASRNIGLDNSKGEYIAFCDDDDIYEENLLWDNYKLAKDFNADMVKFGRKLIDIDSFGKIIREKANNISSKILVRDAEVLSRYFEIKATGKLINVWDGLYSSKIIKEHNLRFDETMKFGSEDADFSLRFYLQSNTIVINPKNYYTHYRRNQSSTSRKYNLNKVDSLIKTAETENEIWKKLDLTHTNKAKIIASINKYIISVYVSQLFHPNCTLERQEKINYLKRFKQLQQFQYVLDSKVLKELIILDFKQALFSILYSKNMYKTTYSLIELFNRFLADKW